MDDFKLTRLVARLRKGLAPAEAIAGPGPGEIRKTAAVLALLVERDGALQVLYTRRSDRLESHRGQVAFPGGRSERRDRELLATALRETEEEIGLKPERSEILGSFEGRQTNRSEIFVTPFVGLVRAPLELRPDPWEVAEIFEVPLAALRARRYRGEYAWELDGVT